MHRITIEFEILERQLRLPGMYLIPPSPVPTTSGFVPNRPSPTFKPLHPATPSPASGSAMDQRIFDSLLNMVDSTQGMSPSSSSSLLCGQRTRKQANSTGSTQQGFPSHSQTTSQIIKYLTSKLLQISNNFQLHNTQLQNVAPKQPSAPVPQPFQQSPVAQLQQLPLLQSPAPGLPAAYLTPQFVQPRVSHQGQPIRQPRQQSPYRQTFNPSAQPFIPAAEAQQNSVLNQQEKKILKSVNGQGVKSSGNPQQLQQQQVHQMVDSVSNARNQVITRKTVQSDPTARNVRNEI